MLNQSQGFRFPKSARLLRSPDFKRVQSRGRKTRTPHLLVIYTPNQLAGSRFGLVVSRKVGNAVQRNWVKRRLRESIRHRRHELLGSWDVAIIPSRNAPSLDFQTLDVELGLVISRLSHESRRHESQRSSRHGGRR